MEDVLPGGMDLEEGPIVIKGIAPAEVEVSIRGESGPVTIEIENLDPGTTTEDVKVRMFLACFPRKSSARPRLSLSLSPLRLFPLCIGLYKQIGGVFKVRRNQVVYVHQRVCSSHLRQESRRTSCHRDAEWQESGQ